MTEIQADPRRCPCGALQKAVKRTTGGGFTIYECQAPDCVKFSIVDIHGVEVK